MQDIRLYDDDELSRRVLDDEYFEASLGDHAYTIALALEEFIYTENQLRALERDLDALAFRITKQRGE